MFPVLGTDESGYVLLMKIQSMPPGKAISFRDAWVFAFDEIWKRMRAGKILGPDDDESTSTYILADVVRYLVQQGFKIHLTGDEFKFLDPDK